MRRSVAVVLTSAALASAALVPANASTSTLVKTVAVDEGTANGASVGTGYCAGTGFMPDSQTFMKVVAQADPNSSSPVSWAPNAAPASGTAWGVAPTSNGPLAATDLQTLKVDVYNGPSGVSEIIAIVGDPAANTATIFSGRSAIPAGTAGTWATVDESNATYVWNEYSLPSMTYKASAGTSTLAAFAVSHASAFYEAHLAFGCAGESDFAVQHLQWGAAGSPNVEDFGTIANSVAIKASAKVITAGSPVTISGSSQYGGAPTATLLSRSANQSAYAGVARGVRSTVIDDLACTFAANTFVCSNPFQAVVARPIYNTLYRWSYPGTTQVDGQSSAFAGIAVRTRITPTFPAGIANQRPFVISGSTYPAKPGSVIAVWGKRGTVTYRLGIARVAANGTFRVPAKVGGPGTWNVWVTLPGDNLNAAGTSVVKRYSVR